MRAVALPICNQELVAISAENLRSIQWSYPNYPVNCCPSCKQAMTAGHNNDCWIGLALGAQRSGELSQEKADAAYLMANGL